MRRPLVAILGVSGCLFSALAAPALREGVWALEPGRGLVLADIAAGGFLVKESIGRVGAAFLSRGWSGRRVGAVIPDGLFVDIQVGLRWRLVAAGGELVEMALVVDFAQRGRLVVVPIKTLPAVLCFLSPVTDFCFPPELLDTLDRRDEGRAVPEGLSEDGNVSLVVARARILVFR